MPQKLALAHIYGLFLTFLYAGLLNMLVMTTLHAQFHVGQEPAFHTLLGWPEIKQASCAQTQGARNLPRAKYAKSTYKKSHVGSGEYIPRTYFMLGMSVGLFVSEAT